MGNRQSSEKKQTGTNESILSMLLTEMDGVGTAHTHHSTNASHKKKETVRKHFIQLFYDVRNIVMEMIHNS